MKDIKEIRLLIALNGNQRLLHYEKEIFANESLTRAYIRQLFNIKRLISSPSQYLIDYARYTIKGRWVEAESKIFDSASSAFYYTTWVHNIGVKKGKCKRLPAAEKFVLRDPWFSYIYARDIINGRWTEAEESILLCDHECAFYYLTQVVKCKNEWKEGTRFVSTRLSKYTNYI